jgi:hypothetical protein
LLLGGAGALWRFDRWGAPVWLLDGVFTGVREALPSFFRIACGPPSEKLATIYLLDPLGRRLFRFDDPGPEAASGAAKPASELAALLDRGLPLQAASFLQASMPETAAEVRLARLAKSRLLKGLVELADQFEAQLRLPEAEAALREAVRLAGELRAVDPVEPSYARDLAASITRRSRLREELLEPGEQDLAAAFDGAVLSLRATSSLPAEQVSVQYRWAGFPPAERIEWGQPIRPGNAVRVPLPLPPAGPLAEYEEEITLSLAVLLSWRQEGRAEQRFLQTAYTVNPGRDLAKAR